MGIRTGLIWLAVSWLALAVAACGGEECGEGDDDAAVDDDDCGDDDATAGDDDDATADDDDATVGDDDSAIGDDDDTAEQPPENFLLVTADPSVGTTEDFYVARYEMKIVGRDDGNVEYDEAYVAQSRPSGIPWQWVNQVQAKAECEALGAGFALLTNEEWMTIARSIEANPLNWSDNQTHPSGETDAQLNHGHTCRVGTLGVQCRMDQFPHSGEGLAASIDDSEGCYGYFPVSGETEAPALDANGWNAYRRTFYLADGQVIWDFAGNVWEWVDWYVPLAEDRAFPDGEITDDFVEINQCEATDAMPDESYKSLNADMDEIINANRLGRSHPTSVDDDAGTAMRGGNFMHGACNNGIYALGMGYPPDTDHLICRVGFRCAWHPLP
jgi:hypothetical protein